MTDKAALLAALAADGVCDGAVLHMGEADYGCEERAEDAEAQVWVLLMTKDGEELPREIPESLAERLHLTEGGLCRLSALHT